MSTDMLQHTVVTLVAFGALVVILRRALGFVLIREKQRGCPNCPASKNACSTQAAPTSGPAAHPAVLVRPSVR